MSIEQAARGLRLCTQSYDGKACEAGQVLDIRLALTAKSRALFHSILLFIKLPYVLISKSA